MAPAPARLSLSRGLVSVERPIEGAGKRSLVNLASLEAHPFGQPLDMGRGVASDPKAGAHERNLDQRGDRSLALGSGDMNRAKGLLRVSETLGQVEHRLEPDPHRAARPVFPVGEGVEARHRARELVILTRRQHRPDYLRPISRTRP